jgi:hypothetical protein
MIQPNPKRYKRKLQMASMLTLTSLPSSSTSSSACVPMAAAMTISAVTLPVPVPITDYASTETETETAAETAAVTASSTVTDGSLVAMAEIPIQGKTILNEEAIPQLPSPEISPSRIETGVGVSTDMAVGVDVIPSVDYDVNTITNSNSNDDYNTNDDYSQQSPRLFILDNHVEFEGHTIGDSHRNSDAFHKFFSAVDLDGDGRIQGPELDTFLHDEIGGSAFDEKEERENEVDIIMEKMDLEGDGRLEMGDVNSYWEKLESLLTVDEVAEWIVHAGQLPKEVGR